ncbi:MAG: 50S ribosomal protein L19 [Deltaproteobacteria bacterium]
MDIIRRIESEEMRMDIPEFRPGDSVRVSVKIQETEEKERIQVFEGIVIARRGSGFNETFTVRKVSYGVGVERTFPIHSPRLEKIELLESGRGNRAKFYYIRGLKAKTVRHKTRARTL